MDEMTYRILSALSRNLGLPMSIQDLTTSMRRMYGKGYYANAYRSVQSLRGDKLLNVARLGKTSAVTPNLSNYRLIDYLTEMEIRRKREVLGLHPRADAVFPSLEACLRGLRVEFAILVAAERNLRLNRVELLVCMASEGTRRTTEALAEVGEKLNIRIDALTLSSSEVVQYLSMPERNPLQEMVADGMAFYHPQAFWATLAEATAAGRQIRVAKPVPLTKMSRTDLIFNLGRLGFPLLGGAPQGRPVCVESTVTAALLSKESRIRAGASVILSKNRMNPRLLSFLSIKYGVDRSLLALLGLITPSPDGDELRVMLSRVGAEPANLNKKSLRATLRTYDAA